MTAALRGAAASLVLLAGLGAAGIGAASAQETTINIGLVRSISP